MKVGRGRLGAVWLLHFGAALHVALACHRKEGVGRRLMFISVAVLGLIGVVGIAGRAFSLSFCYGNKCLLCC